MTGLLALLLTSVICINNNNHLEAVSCIWTSNPTTTNPDPSTKDTNSFKYDKSTGTLKLTGKINWFKQTEPEGLGFPTPNYRANFEIDCKEQITAFYTLNEGGFVKRDGNYIKDNNKIGSLWFNFQANGKLKFIIVQTGSEASNDLKNYTLLIDANGCTFGSITDETTVVAGSTITKSTYLGKRDESDVKIDKVNKTILVSNVGYYDKSILNYPNSGYRSAVRIEIPKAASLGESAYIRRFKDADGHVEQVPLKNVLDSPNEAESGQFFNFIQGYGVEDFNSFGLLIVSWTGNAYDEEYIYFKATSFDNAFRMDSAFRYPLNCDSENDAITDKVELTVEEIKPDYYKVIVTGTINYFTGNCGVGMSQGWRAGYYLRLFNKPADTAYYTINEGNKKKHTDFINPEEGSLYSDIDLISSISKLSRLKPIFVESPSRSFTILIDTSGATLQDHQLDPTPITTPSVVTIDDTPKIFSEDAAVYDTNTIKKVTGKLKFVSADVPEGMGFPHAGYRVSLKISPGEGVKIADTMYFYTQNEEGGRPHGKDDLDGDKTYLNLYQSAEDKDRLRYLIISWTGQYTDEEYIYFDLSGVTYADPGKTIMPARLRDQSYASVNDASLKVSPSADADRCTVTGNVKWVTDINNLFTYDCYRIALMFDIPFPVTRFYTLNEEGYRKHDLTTDDKVTFGTTEGCSIGLILNIQKYGLLKNIIIETEDGNTTYWIDASEVTHADHQGVAAAQSIVSGPKEGHGVSGEYTIGKGNMVTFTKVKAYPGAPLGFKFDGFQAAINFQVPEDVTFSQEKGYYRAFKDNDGNLKQNLIRDALNPDVNSKSNFDYVQAFSDQKKKGILIISWTGNNYDEEYYYFQIGSIDTAFHIERSFRIPITITENNAVTSTETLKDGDTATLSNINGHDKWYTVKVSGTIRAFDADSTLGFSSGWRAGITIRLYNPPTGAKFYTLNEGNWVERGEDYFEKPTDGSIDMYRDFSLFSSFQPYSPIKQLRLKTDDATEYHFIIDASEATIDKDQSVVTSTITQASTVAKIDLPQSDGVTFNHGDKTNVYKITGQIPLYPAGIPEDGSFNAQGNRVGAKISIDQAGFTIGDNMYFITIKDGTATKYKKANLVENSYFNVYFDVKENNKFQFFTVSWTGNLYDEEFIYFDFSGATLSENVYNPENPPVQSGSDDQQSDSSVSGEDGDEGKPSDTSISGEVGNEGNPSDSSVSGDNDDKKPNDSSISGDDDKKPNDSSILDTGDEKPGQVSQSDRDEEPVPPKESEEETPTKVIPIPIVKGLAVLDDCKDTNYEDGCISPDQVASFNLGGFDKDLTIIIGTDLKDGQTFNFSKTKSGRSISIIGQKGAEIVNFTIKLRDFEFSKLEITNIRLSFNTSLTSFFQCKQLTFNNVKVTNDCNTVILSNIDGFSSDDPEQKKCFQEKTVEKLPPTTLALTVKDECNPKDNSVDDSIMFQCVLPSQIPSYDFSKNGSSLKTIQITFTTSADKELTFDFQNVQKSTTLLLGGQPKTQEFALDLRKIGQNIDTLIIVNANISFVTDATHDTLTVNTFILKNLGDLDQSSHNVNISSVKNLDFDVPEYYDAFKKDDKPKDSVTVTGSETITKIVITDKGLNITYSSGSFDLLENDANEMVVKVTEDSEIEISAEEGHAPRRVTIETSKVVTVKVDENIPTDISFGAKSPLLESSSSPKITYIFHKYDVPLYIDSCSNVEVKVESAQKADNNVLSIKGLVCASNVNIFVPDTVTTVSIGKVVLNDGFGIAKSEINTNIKNLRSDAIVANIDDLAIESYSQVELTNPIKIAKSLKVDVLGQLKVQVIDFVGTSSITVTYFKGVMWPCIIDSTAPTNFPTTVKIENSELTDGSPDYPTLFKIMKLNEETYNKVSLVDASSKYDKNYIGSYLTAVKIIQQEEEQGGGPNDNNVEPTSKKPNIPMIIGIVVGCVVVVVIIILVTYFTACRNKKSSSSSSSSSVSSI